MRVAILMTGHTPEPHRSLHGDYDQHFQKLLFRKGVVWSMYDVQQGAYPADVNDHDAYVVTGSAADAHGSDPWIATLNAFLRVVYAAKKRLLGICFGHQAIANALGGRSEPSPQGWEAGCHKVQLQAAFFRQPYAVGESQYLDTLALHRDHVSQLPPGGELLASNAHSRVQMYRVGEHVLCMQGHPEFSKALVADLVSARCQRGLISLADAAQMLDSLQTPVQVERLRALCCNFLYGTA